MKNFITLSLFLLLSGPLLSQQEHTLRKAYRQVSLQELLNDVEQYSDLRFYYQEQQTDSVVLKDLSIGASFFSILKEGLAAYQMHYMIRGEQVFIYRGSEIVVELPEYGGGVLGAGGALGTLGTGGTLGTLGTLGAGGTGGGLNEGGYIRTNGLIKEKELVVGVSNNGNGHKKCRVYGLVTNTKDKEPLIGATIFLKELELGTISDVDGYFELEVFPGEYSLIVNHMAMKEEHYQLKVLSKGRLSLELENDFLELQEVTVSSDRFDNVKSLKMGQDRISMKNMKEIPIVMGEKDILQVAQMLPGVQNVGEGSSGMNIRGGSADQNIFYINNISVYNTSHLFGFFSAFNPDVINDFTLYKNNIPTKYGGRIASVFEISTRTGNKESFFAHGGASPVTGHFSLEGPIVKEKVSFVASYRSTYSDWLLKRMKDPELQESSASFYDGTVGVDAEINDKNHLSLFYYQSSDKFSLSSTNDYSYSTAGASAIWKHTFTSALTANVSLASSNYQFEHINMGNVSEAYVQDYSIRHSEFRTDFLLLKYDNHRIEFGLNSILYNLNRGDILPYGEESERRTIQLGNEQGLESAVYVSDEISISSRLSLLAGLRFNSYNYLGPAEVINYFDDLPREENNIVGSTKYASGENVKWYSGLEPRLALNYRLSNESSLKFSYNRLNQYVFLLSNTIAISPTDQWKMVDYHIRPPVVDQVSAGYYRDSKNKELSASVEVYKKWGNNIVDYKNGANFITDVPLEQMILQGKQNSYGLEVLLKKDSRKLSGWVSYTYSRSILTVDGTFASEKINRGNPYPSNFDRPHSANLVSNYRLGRRISFSSNVVYSTGRPVTLPVSVYYADGNSLILYSDRNAYRIPDYFRVDLSMNIEGNLKFQKLGHSYWMFNIYNLTSRENAYSVYYTIESGKIKGYKLSIFARPIVTLSWHLKLGNYSND